MIGRRDLLIGAAGFVALGTAEALRPRTTISLGGRVPLTDLVPSKLGDWELHNGGDIVVPKVEGSLADRLYNDQLSRVYIDAARQAGVMLVIAYGQAQNDLLQLHRPEACYPAIGFTITSHRFSELPIGNGQTVPVVELTARSGDRIEDIVYWTRVAEYLPLTGAQQRSDLLKTAMAGYIGDGALVRASAVRRNEADGTTFANVHRFLETMVRGIAPGERQVLIGTERGRALASLKA